MIYKNLLYLSILIECFIMLIGYYAFGDSLDEGYLSLLLSFKLINIFLFFKGNNIFKSFFRISSLFLISFIIVHFQMYLELILGNYKTLGHNYLIDEKLINKAVTISSMAFNIFIFAYSNFSFSKIKIKELKNEKKKKKFKTQLLKIIIITLFLVFLTSTDAKYFMGGYGRSGIALNFLSEISMQFLVYSILLYLIIITINSKDSIEEKSKKNSLSQFLYIYDLKVIIVIFSFCSR